MISRLYQSCYNVKGSTRLRILRGTPLDPFAWSSHRRLERSLVGWYMELVREARRHLTPETLPLVEEIAALPDGIRGYEGIKEESIGRVQASAREKLGALRQDISEIR